VQPGVKELFRVLDCVRFILYLTDKALISVQNNSISLLALQHFWQGLSYWRL